MVNGGFAYGYLFMSQHPDAYKVFKEILSDIKPNNILEIGTFHGGLTLMLRDILDELNLLNSDLRTYDIDDQEFLKPLVIDRKVDVITKNLFNDDYSNFKNGHTKKELYDFINRSGTTVVLCDGGCKVCEFNLIAPLLKNKDIIMAHDYAPNISYFEKYMKDKIWNWMEIKDEDVHTISQTYNLKPYKQDIMQSIAWLSKQKA
jgi:hypothetical protein